MKKSIFTLALTALLFGGALNTNAQDNNDRESRRAEMRAKQMERVIKDLKLSDEQRAKFEPVYAKYQEELSALMTQKGKKDDGKNGEKKDKKEKEELTDAVATARLQQLFDRQADEIQKSQQRLDIQKKYCAQFSGFLTPQQLLRVFQTRENHQRRQQNGNMQNGRAGRGGFGGQQGMGGPRGGFGGGPQGDF